MRSGRAVARRILLVSIAAAAVAAVLAVSGAGWHDFGLGFLAGLPLVLLVWLWQEPVPPLRQKTDQQRLHIVP
ncbi:MAG: hypothetical protein ACRD04_14375 [Terriglobales bacterium]